MKPAALVPLEVLKAFETVPDLYLVLSPELEVLTASDAFLRASRSGREEWVGKNLFGETLPGNLEQYVFSPTKVEDAFRQVLSGKEPHQLSMQLHSEFPCTNGTTNAGQKFLRLHLTPGFNGHQELQYLLVKVEDQTELLLCRETVQAITRDTAQLKKAEEELKQNQQLLQATLDSSQDMIQVFEAVRDESGEIVDFKWVLNNHTSEKCYGNVIGQSLLQANPGVRETGIFDTFKRVMETGQPEQSERHYMHEQFNGWFFQSVVKLNDGVATTTSNITERKKAEEELRKSKELVQTVFDVSLNPIAYHKAVRDQNGKIVDFEFQLENRVARQYALQERRGQKYSEAYPGIKDTDIFRLYAEVVETGNTLNTEVQVPIKGTDHWFQFMAVKLNDGLVATALDITERKKNEQEIIGLKNEIAQKATDKYQALFNSIDEGFAIQEVVTDENGNVTDVIYLEVNKAFEQISGMKDVPGKKVSEILPRLEQHWLDALTQVYQTGKPLRGENYSADLDRWFTYHYSRIGEAGSPFIAVVFNDITERKKREQQQEFLLKLSDILQRLEQPNDIKTAAMQLLGKHLGVSRAQYHECDSSGEYYSADGVGYADGLPLLELKYRIDDFGTFVAEDFEAGRPFRIGDLWEDPRPTAAEQEAYRTYQIWAGAGIPLLRGGKLVAILAVHDMHPHPWTDLEMELIRETAERVWMAVERIRAEEALRKSEEKYRSLFQSIDEGFCLIERVSTEPLDFRYLEANPAFATQSGVPDVVGKTLRQVARGESEEWLAIYDQVLRTREPLRFEREFLTTRRVLELYAFPLASGGDRLAVLFKDITERKQREQQQEFLLEFSDALRAEPNADAVAKRSLQILSEQLGLDRCYIAFYQLDADRADITHQVGNDRVPPLPEGGIRLSDFPEAFHVVFDRTLVIDDSSKTESLSSTDRSNMGALGLGALVAATLRKGENNPHWVIVAVSATPRVWTDSEIQLIEEVTERTWVAVEKAKAEEALRQREAQLNAIFSALPVGIGFMDTKGQMLLSNEEMRYYLPNNIMPSQDERHANRWEAHQADGTLVGRADYPGARALRGEYVVPGLEMRYHPQEGTQIWTRVAAAPVKDQAGTIKGSVAVITDITELKQTAEALRKSEEKYLSLFNSIDEGFCIIEVLFDEAGAPYDYRFLEANASFVKQTGLENAIGRTMKELAPAHEEHWFEIYGRIAKTGTPERFNAPAKALGFHYDVYAFRMDAPQGHHVAILFNEITERKQREQQQKYLLKLNEILRSTGDPIQIEEEVTRLAMEHFGADRCYYCTIEGDQAFIRRDARRDGLPSVAGSYPLSSFALFRKAVEGGVPLVVHDTNATDLLDEPLHELCLQWQVVSFLDVPVVKNGKATGILCLVQSIHRTWTGVDVQLAVETAERTWAAVERARAEDALRESEERQAFLLRLSDTLRALPDAASIKDQAVRMLAGHLRLDRCWISEVFEQKGISTVGPEHIRPGLSSMSGVFQLSDYPETMRQLVTQPMVIEDAAHDPSFSDSEKELLAGLQLRAILVVPLRKGESQVIWALAASMTTPRPWTYHERMLLEETVERTWAAVERAQAERALADSEEQFRRAIEDAPIPVIMHAEDGEVLQISHSWTELTGYRQEEVPTFDHWLTQAYGEGADKVRSHMQHLFTGHRRTVDIDFPVRTLRSEVRHWSFSASSPGTLKDGRRFIVGMAVDITERRRAEEQLQEFNAQLEQQVAERTQALQESKELLETSANTSPLGMVVVKSIRNASGRIVDFEYVWLNAVSQEMAGEDVIGCRMLQKYPHIKDIGLFAAYVQAVEQDGRVDFEEYFSPTQSWFRWLAAKLDDGLFISVEDITERKKAEKSVAEHLTLLRQSEEVARMGSWEYNLQTGAYRWSDGMYRLFGLPLGTLVHPETYLEYVVEEDRATAQKMVEGLRQGREPKEDTFRVKVGEGELLLKVKGIALRNGQGQVEKVLGVDLDLSEVHRLEQENLQIKLEQQKALLLAILEAQEEERRRISESLHNGVAQILYATKLNLGRAKEQDVESGKEENQPLQTVEDLLTEAINETRRVSHELVPMLLQEFGLQVALESMCRKFEESALFLQCKVEGLEQRLEPYLEIALFRMSQELVNNIVKHSGATAATLSICKEGEQVLLQAKDNGRGIQNVAANLKGIGLRSIQDRVKLLNGTLTVSAPKSGKGTLITIKVPARF
ncbi:PAS domain S-box protein [Sabulibacter ruber]|uniref:PAS domain S-box protein n=1 Tax=Sabulibacter ruber TaxID=2811901 RepID=UPI001A97C1D8|nr:PAS domain S-box protein [Sabulibacter ruber]